ncbi:hypothetical protein FRC03_007499, partial [Tulasnella sp. 419]
GMRVVFLPPYSPDFNPIELAFSAIKAQLLQEEDTIRSAMLDCESDAQVYICLSDLVYSVTDDDTWGWFCKC